MHSRCLPTVVTHALPETTESVRSDDPAPPSSAIFAPTIPKFSLENSFPSILSTLALMQATRVSADGATLNSLSQVFVTCFRDIVRSIDNLPHNVRMDPDCELAYSLVVFQAKLLREQISDHANGVPSASISMTLEFAELIVAGLQSYLDVAGRVVARLKPLPTLPVDGLTVLPVRAPDDPLPLITIVEHVLGSSESISDTTCKSGGVGASVTDAKRKKRRSGSIIRRILHKRSAASGFSFHSESTFTLVDRGCLASDVNVRAGEVKAQGFLADPRSRVGEIPYLPRQSVFYNCADPYCPDVEVEMPIPTGNTVAVRLDAQGQMKAASLTALVRLLTSKRSVLDQDLTATFYLTFRFYTSPKKYVEELIYRFNAKPPEALDPPQLRVWTREAMAIRLRVGKTILTWLEVYWRPDLDKEALEILQRFALDQLVKELPEGMSAHILESLDLLWNGEPVCPLRRKIKDLEFVYYQLDRPPLVPTDIEIALDMNSDLDSTAHLLKFNTPNGREEFARQLTASLSEKFRHVDPEDAVRYWHTNEESDAGRLIQEITRSERALCTWVISTVLEQEAIEDRVVLLEFWLDVAARCLRLHNFSSANSIFCGVSNSPIIRMKQTVLSVGYPAKQQFRSLHAFVGGQDNFADYRESLESFEPNVPLLPPLIRDIVSALAVVPTSVGQTVDSEEKNLINLLSYRVVTKTVRALDHSLIPYSIPRNIDFRKWLDNRLSAFPGQLDDQINDSLYKLSQRLEPKEPALSHLAEPWLYTITGTLPDNFQYRAITEPPPKLTTTFKRNISVFLKRRR